MRAGVVFSRLAVVGCVSAFLSACVTAPVGPGHPGTRTHFKAPNAEKWVMQRIPAQRRTIYRCRPLACPDKSVVVITFSNSPTRDPDPQALKRYAHDLADHEIAFPGTEQGQEKSVVRDLSLISSRVAPVHGYPAVTWDYKGHTKANGETIYFVVARLFAGSSLITVNSVSPTLEIAKKNGLDFIGAMQIEDFPRSSANKPGT